MCNYCFTEKMTSSSDAITLKFLHLKVANATNSDGGVDTYTEKGEGGVRREMRKKQKAEVELVLLGKWGMQEASSLALFFS